MLATLCEPPDTQAPRNSIPGCDLAEMTTRNAISRRLAGVSSAGRVSDQLHAIAVPAELHDAVQPGRAVGVHKRNRVAGAAGLVDAVEPVGVRHPRRDELAEVEQ